METTALDTLFINNLELPIRIGCLADERSQPQVISIDLAIGCDMSLAAGTKNIADTICYVTTSDLIKALAYEQPYVLLEEFGSAVCAAIFARYIGATEITLTIRKFVVRNAGSVGVVLRRRRPDPR